MERLKEIEAFINREYLNLYKNKTRGRTLSGIQTKTIQLQELFTEYKILLQSLRYRIRTENWNEEVEVYTKLKETYNKCINILDNTPVTQRGYDSEPEVTNKKLLLKPDINDSLSRANSDNKLATPSTTNSFSRTNSDIHLIKRKFKLKILAKLIIWCKRAHTAVSMALNIKTAAELATLIPAYDGNSGGVKSFVDAVNLVKTIVPAENKAAAIQVILTKLSGKARNLFATIPDDYDGITQALISNCSEKSTSDSAKSNLNNLKLKSPSDLQNFTKQVDSLAEKLTETYITEKIPSEVAKKMSQKAAIQTLVANASNSETKIMLKVGKFTNLQEAINIMVENENVTTSTSNAVVLNATSNRNRYQNNNVNRIPQRNNNQRTNFNNRYQPRFPLNNYRNHSNHNNQYNQQQNNRNFNRFNRGFNQHYNQNR